MENLGKQHVAYRVEKKHYYTLGLALLDTLETCLGDDFTPEIKDAWLSTYTTMSSVMIDVAC